MDSKKRKSRTMEIYRYNFKYYIKPTFAEARISSITSRAVQKWVNGMVKDDYDSDTIRLAFGVFRGAIRYALDHEMLLKSPCEELNCRRKRSARRTSWSLTKR